MVPLTKEVIIPTFTSTGENNALAIVSHTIKNIPPLKIEAGISLL